MTMELAGREGMVLLVSDQVVALEGGEAATITGGRALGRISWAMMRRLE